MVTVPTLAAERRLWRDGHRWVAGLDEVGRGAWAGPVSVGIAVLNTGCRSRSMPAWLRDSKALPEERREAVFDEVAAWCADAAVGHAAAAECDQWGMTAALRLAAYRALAQLELAPDALLVDGPYDLLRPRSLLAAVTATRTDPGAGLRPGAGAGPVGGNDPDPGDDPETEPPGSDAPDARVAPFGPDRPLADLPLPDVQLPEAVVPVVDGDAHCAAVAAASVLAKVVRDRLMRADAEHYPHYGFERNKGYPSPAHRTALRGYGLSAIHRRSWAYVADLPWR